jgi:ribonuclease VapC
MPERYVLDSFALLALLGGEAGGAEVVGLLRQAQQGTAVSMAWINAGEVAYIVERRWGRERVYEVLAFLEATGTELVPVGQELALEAAHIKAGHTLSYADAFAAALALIREATLVTGDPELKPLEGRLSIRWIGKT